MSAVDGGSSDPGRRPWEWAVGIGVAGVLVGAVLWVSGPRSPSASTDAQVGSGRTQSVAPAFPDLVIPGSIVEAWRAERAAMPGEPDGATVDLLRAWSVTNFVSGVQQVGTFEGDAAAAQAEYRAALGRWFRVRDAAAYRSLSWAAYDRFMAGLATASGLEGSGAIVDRLWDVRSAAVQAHFESCGDFVSIAVGSGLMAPDGTLSVDPALVAIVFRYRWFAAAQSERPLTALMPGDEYEVFLRWRFERALGVPEATRLRYAEEFFVQFPDFAHYTLEEARAAITGVSE